MQLGQKRIAALTVATFFLVLSTPLVGTALHLGDDRKALAFEMTSPAPTVPKTLRELKQWPNMFRRYFNAHFAFRAPLMQFHASLKVRGFGVTSSDKVVLGQDGWLFYAGEQAMDDYRCAKPFTDSELTSWLRALVGRRDWLRARGIEYIFYVAPNGQTIYPEYLPVGIRKIGPASRLDQLTGFLESHSDIRLVDVRPALLREKASDRLYFKTDTHWNQLGAFVAYEQLETTLAKLFPQWRRDEPGDFKRVQITDWSGDLTLMLGTRVFRETRIDFVLRRDIIRGDASASAIERSLIVLETDSGEISSAVVLRDSFFAAQSAFVARHFRRTVLLSTHDLDVDMVEREHPNVVIQEMVERALMGPAPTGQLLPADIRPARVSN